MRAISGLEVARIVSELQEIAGARVDKIYQVEKRLIFELYKGKNIKLVIEAGKRLNLTGHREQAPQTPPGFCTLLRNRLKGTRLAEIRQHDFDRVVVLKFEGRATYFLVAELFAKGNLVLCDSEMVIVQPLKVEFWKGRSVKPKTEYLFPPSGFNLMASGKAGFAEGLKSSKKNLVSTLVGMGLGKRGEEICDGLGLDRKLEAGKLTDSDIGKVWKEVDGLLKGVKDSKGLNASIDMEFTEGLEEEVGEEANAREEKARKKWEKRKKGLEDAVAEIERELEENKREGAWIQANNMKVQEILTGVRKDLKSGMGKAEVEKKYGVKLSGEKVILEAGSS